MVNCVVLNLFFLCQFLSSKWPNAALSGTRIGDHVALSWMAYLVRICGLQQQCDCDRFQTCLRLWVALPRIVIILLVQNFLFKLQMLSNCYVINISILLQSPGVPWSYSGKVPLPNRYMFQTHATVPKYRHATTYWLSMEHDEKNYTKLTCKHLLECYVLKQVYEQHFDPVTSLDLSSFFGGNVLLKLVGLFDKLVKIPQDYDDDCASFTIRKFIVRQDPWGMVVVYQHRGMNVYQEWSMVVFKLNDHYFTSEEDKECKLYLGTCMYDFGPQLFFSPVC